MATVSIGDHPRQKVFLRAKWKDQWVEKPYLHCKSFRKSSSPDISRAEFEWRFGVGMQTDKVEFLEYKPLDLDRQYVKVEIYPYEEDGETPKTQPSLRWYGIFGGDDNRDLNGALQAPGGSSTSRVPSGKQHLVAFGLESLLDRVVVRSSYTLGATKPVPRGLPFNGGSGGKLHEGETATANRADDTSTFRFAPRLDEGYGKKKWTSEQIVRYLLKEHPPRDKDDAKVFEFELAGQFTSLKGEPYLESHDRSVKSLLDELIDRRRILGYRVEVNRASPTDEKPTVVVFTNADVEITLADGTKIQKNTNQKSLDFDGDADVLEARLNRGLQHKVDRVRVRGARRVGCCTLRQDPSGTGDTSLNPKWVVNSLAKYNQGASETDDYPDEDDRSVERNVLNQIFRARREVRRVFRVFGFPDNWDGMVGGKPLCPKLDDDGKPTSVIEQFWPPGLRFRKELPLLEGYDYSISVDDPTPDTAGATTIVPEPLSPFGMLREPDKVETSDPTPRWFPLDRAGQNEGGEHDRISAGMRMLDDEFALELNVAGGPPHILGAGSFSPLQDLDEDDAAIHSWEKLALTVAVEFDASVEVVYPKNPTVVDGEVIRELLIDLDDARLDYVAKGTVLDVDDEDPSKLLSVEEAGFVRDDRPRMKRVAETAYQWYSRERQAFSFRRRKISDEFTVGDLITQLGTGSTLENVRTVVTSIDWDLDGGTTSITTDFAELDASAGARS